MCLGSLALALPPCEKRTPACGRCAPVLHCNSCPWRPSLYNSTARASPPSQANAHSPNKQVVRERLDTISKEARRGVLQQHAELCALAVGVEAIPSLDSETLPEVAHPPKAGVIQRV